MTLPATLCQFRASACLAQSALTPRCARTPRQEAEERRAALEKERSRPFARYANDAELDADRKRVSRWGDPLVRVVTRHRRRPAHHSARAQYVC